MDPLIRYAMISFRCASSPRNTGFLPVVDQRRSTEESERRLPRCSCAAVCDDVWDESEFVRRLAGTMCKAMRLSTLGVTSYAPCWASLVGPDRRRALRIAAPPAAGS